MFKIKTKIFHLIIIYFSILLLVSCATIKTGTHYDKKYYFRGYKSFTWISKDPIYKGQEGVDNISPLTLKQITNSIQTNLESKGYEYIDDISLADFVLSYTVGSRDKFSMESYPVIFRNYWNWYWTDNCHLSNQWHLNTWTKGTLTIDIFDNKIKQPIWHGWATKTISESDRINPSVPIKEAVNKIFKNFPSLNLSKVHK